MKILVSLFHADEKTDKIWVFDSDLKLLKSFANSFSNIKGLCVDGDKIYAGHKNKDGKCSLLIFSRSSYLLIKSILLPDVLDIHSLKIWRAQIYVVSSGSNCIAVYDLEELLKKDNKISTIKIITTNLTSIKERDTIHLNSIFFQNDGSIWISGFGEKDENTRWLSTRNGFVVDFGLGKEKFIAQKLYHPHSIFISGNDHWFCESGNRKVYKNNIPVIDTVGYARGLFVKDDGALLFVGTSASRKYGEDVVNKDVSSVHKYIKKGDQFELEMSYSFDDKNAEI